MKKYIKYLIGILIFVTFVFVDQSFVGYKGIISRIKDWANDKRAFKGTFEQPKR